MSLWQILSSFADKKEIFFNLTDPSWFRKNLSLQYCKLIVYLFVKEYTHGSYQDDGCLYEE